MIIRNILILLILSEEMTISLCVKSNNVFDVEFLVALKNCI